MRMDRGMNGVGREEGGPPNYKPVLQIRCHSRHHRPENENVESSSQSSFSLFTLITPFADSAAFKASTPYTFFFFFGWSYKARATSIILQENTSVVVNPARDQD